MSRQICKVKEIENYNNLNIVVVVNQHVGDLPQFGDSYLNFIPRANYHGELVMLTISLVIRVNKPPQVGTANPCQQFPMWHREKKRERVLYSDSNPNWIRT